MFKLWVIVKTHTRCPHAESRMSQRLVKIEVELDHF